MKNFLKLNSLRKKFVLIVTVILLVVFFSGGLVTILDNIKQTRKFLTEQAIAFAKLSTKPLADSYDLYFDSGYFKFKELFAETKQLDPNIKKIQFIDVNGKIIFDSDRVKESSYQEGKEEIVNQVTLDKVVSSEPTYVYSPKTSNEVIEIFYPYFSEWGSHPYTVRYYVSYDEVRANIITIIEKAVILLIISFIFATLIITGTVNRLILSPITQVSKLAQRISEGKYKERIKAFNTGDEIENLANSTNKMARKLEQDIIDLKELDKLKDEFIDVATHNFKIPLNHLKYDIAYLLKAIGNKVNEKEFLLMKDINISGKKLELLSEDLIGIQALRNNETGNIFFPIDLSALIMDVFSELKNAAEAKGIKLKSELKDKAVVLGDYVKLKQLFLNIVDNAIQYTDKKEGSVNVSVQEKGNSYTVKVEDTGVGMTPDELKKLFQKFYRAPSSAIYNKEGAGLGLYLAKLIVNVHHGNIWVESKKDKGSSFYVSLLKKEALGKN